MSDLTPRIPRRPLFWSDALYNLQEALTGEEVYIVGGAVRDAYLHRPVQDLDLVTPGGAIRLARKIANHFHGDVFVLDADRDVGRALVETPEGRLTVDVAGMRGGNLLDDLRDRDFTFNAMAVDLQGDLSLIIDPLNGEQDISEKRVRRCSPQSIQNDPIRGLRAVRQSAQLNYRLDPDTLRDIRENAGRLWTTSPERVRDEFFKILAAQKPSGALRVADALGLLPVILPELNTLKGVREHPSDVLDAWTHTLTVIERLTTVLTAISPARNDNTLASFEMASLVSQFAPYTLRLRQHLDTPLPNDRSYRALLTLAALLHQFNDAGALAELHADNLHLSTLEKQRLAGAVRHHQHSALTEEDVTPLVAHRYWYKLGAVGVDAALLSLTDVLAALVDTRDWLARVERVRRLFEAYFDKHDEIVAPVMLVDGNALQQQLGLKPGRKIGELLTLIREGQVTGAVRTVEEALQLAREHL